MGSVTRLTIVGQTAAPRCAESLEMLLHGACCLTTGGSSVTYEVKNLCAVCHICPDQRSDTDRPTDRPTIGGSSSSQLVRQLVGCPPVASHASSEQVSGFSRTASLLLPNEHRHRRRETVPHRTVRRAVSRRQTVDRRVRPLEHLRSWHSVSSSSCGRSSLIYSPLAI